MPRLPGRRWWWRWSSQVLLDDAGAQYSQVLLDGAGAKYPGVREDADEGDGQEHGRQRGPTGVVEGCQERVLDDRPDHGVAGAPQDLLVHVVAEGRDEREQERREYARDAERQDDPQEALPFGRVQV